MLSARVGTARMLPSMYAPALGGRMTRFRLPLAAAAAIAVAAPLRAQTPAATPAPAPAAVSRGPAIPSKEQIAEGKAVFAKVVAWLGGPQKISSVKDVRTRGRLTAKTDDSDTT